MVGQEDKITKSQLVILIPIFLLYRKQEEWNHKKVIKVKNIKLIKIKIN